MEVPEDLRQILINMGFVTADQIVMGEPLTGGVSSDIWRIDVDNRSVCVKRALRQLKVSREWRAPINRNAYEVAWFKIVANIAPAAIPKILAHDSSAGVFVMDFLPPEENVVWKSQLHNGLVEHKTVLAMAEILVRIHCETAGDKSISEQFDNDELFCSLRLEPYFHATGEIHTDLRPQLMAVAALAMENKKALVHGDVSPKNILVGTQGPIILDAECAWYGDPAFDLAFCLNHLLLKCIWNPSVKPELIAGFDLFVKTYLSAVNWECKKALEKRVARILAGLMLGRIDGKSPVEYINDEAEKDKVRDFARQFLLRPADRLSSISAAWLALK